MRSSEPPAPAALLVALLASLVPAAGCGTHRTDTPAPAARPRAREITITTVPLLVREQAGTFPFLKADFARGGVLEGREVYAFVPSTITAVEGDTLHLSVINPEDDFHTLVLPGLALALPGQRTTRATYPVPPAGVYAFTCNVPGHLPMMSGQLVVLSAQAVAPAAR